ncbi:MAG TPA: type II secretion system F family protein [Anaerolineales bacterium]|nr:type II secretion system F family protein [Anaerolineales bacterium]
MVGLAMALTFMAVFLLVLVLVPLVEGFERSPMRLLRRRFAAASQQKATVRVFRDDTLSGLPVLDRWLSRAAFARKLLRYLAQADISQRVGVVLGAVLLMALLGGRLVWSVTSSWYWSVLGVGALGSLPLLYVRRRRRVRLGLYAEQLPNALDVLTRSLQAGLSFLQGVQAVAREMPEPTAREFRMTFEQLRLGRSLRDALESHSERVENLDFKLLSTALLIQRAVGGNLTEILENTSRTIRERFKLLGQIQTLTAQTRLSGRIVAALPIAIGVMIYLLRRELIMVLFTEEIGRTLVAIAVVMQIMGFYVINRITTIKI